MNYESMPLIEIRLEGMKHGIVSHLGAENSILGEMIEKRIDEIIASGTIEGQINESIQDCIQKYMIDTFSFGKGYSIIKTAVDNALDELFKEEK